MSEKICNCPVCRAHRGEISRENLAWYLKGKIEKANSILISKDSEVGSIKWDVATQYNMDEDENLLNEIISKHLKNPDKALLEPKKYVLD